jgi:hypothetical protein
MDPLNAGFQIGIECSLKLDTKPHKLLRHFKDTSETILAESGNYLFTGGKDESPKKWLFTH